MNHGDGFRLRPEAEAGGERRRAFENERRAVLDLALPIGGRGRAGRGDEDVGRRGGAGNVARPRRGSPATTRAADPVPRRFRPAQQGRQVAQTRTQTRAEVYFVNAYQTPARKSLKFGPRGLPSFTQIDAANRAQRDRQRRRACRADESGSPGRFRRNSPSIAASRRR